MISGMEKRKKHTDFRLPITAQLLVKIIEKLPIVSFTQQETTLFKPLFSLAFFGFFCVGELVAESKGFSIHAIKLSDIVFKVNGSVLEVRIPHSKTDQLGKGTVLSLKCTGAFLCPVCSMQSYLKVRPKVSGQLFYSC